MRDEAQADYLDRWMDRFLWSRDIAKAYFAYSPCGLGWCWSRRLYHALASRTVPVLTGSDIIMPFERFIDWERLTVKVSAGMWRNESTGQTGQMSRFRQRLRREADLFRLRLDVFLRSVRGRREEVGVPRASNVTQYIRRELNSTTEARLALTDTLLWRKMTAIQHALDLLYWNTSVAGHTLPWRHPWKLLQLEMWCALPLQQRQPPTRKSDPCTRPVNRIAEREYPEV
jgi:hypothetical protein